MTVVEFAFVFPILALLFAALADLGFVVLGSSVASGAARDGARIGTIHYLDADDTSSEAFGLIEDAVSARLLGWIKPGTGAFVTVRCLDGDDVTDVKACNDDIEIDKDLLEVLVSWEAVAATGLLPVDRTQTDVSRMVITGGAEGDGAPPAAPGASTVGFAATTYATTETDGSSAATLTVTRSSSNGTASVNLSTSDGTATSPDDFATLATTVNFADGDASETVTVEIVGDDTSEGTETFTATLSNPIGATLLAGSTTATITLTDDDGAVTDTTPPSLTGLEMRDVDHDGRVDQVIARFSETLGSCSSSGAWTLASAPSGATLGSVAVSGALATLTLNEGGGAPNTAVGSFTLSLSSATAGICDPAGNRASLGPTSPADFAGPALIAVSDTGGVDGKAENGDTMTFTFSEAIAVAPTTTTVTVTEANPSVMSMPGILNGSVSLGASYAEKNLTFNDSPVTKSGATLTVTLAKCATNGQCSSRALAATTPSLTLAPAGTLTDVVGRGAVGSVTLTNVKVF